MSFRAFINETEMVSFSGFLRAIGWICVVLFFATVAGVLMLTKEEKAMSWGFQLAIAVLSGLGFASTVGAYNTKTVRTTAKEYAGVAEAKERGKAQGKASESPTVHAENVDTVEVNERPVA